MVNVVIQAKLCAFDLHQNQNQRLQRLVTCGHYILESINTPIMEHGIFHKSQQILYVQHEYRKKHLYILDCRKIHKGVAMKCTMCQGRFLFAGALYSHLCFGTPNLIIKNEVDPNNKTSLAHGSGGKCPPYNTLPDAATTGLGGEFTVVEAKDDDGSANTIVLRYQCNVCGDVQLPGFFNYMIQLRKEHSRCELCLEAVETQKELEHHMKKHKLNHFCWKSGVTYCAKPNFLTQLFWKHGSESKECSTCLKKEWPHIYHFCVPPQVFTCETCGFYFTKPKNLVVYRRLHTGEKMHKCTVVRCNEQFISKKLLEKHILTVHSGDNRDLGSPLPKEEQLEDKKDVDEVKDQQIKKEEEEEEEDEQQVKHEPDEIEQQEEQNEKEPQPQQPKLEADNQTLQREMSVSPEREDEQQEVKMQEVVAHDLDLSDESSNDDDDADSSNSDTTNADESKSNANKEVKED